MTFTIILWLAGIFVGLPVAGLLIQGVGLALDRWRYPAPGDLIQVGGHKQHYYVSGAPVEPDLPMVLLEAGIASSNLAWRWVQREVESFARVASYDRAGLGWSEAATTPRTTKQVVHELFSMLDEAGDPPPVILVGHSFGGMTTLAAACLHPERVAGIVLVDPLHPAEWMLPDPNRKRMLDFAVLLSERGAWMARFGIVRSVIRIMLIGSTGSARLINRAATGPGSGVAERLIGEIRKMPRALWPMVRSHWTQAKSFRSMADHLRQLPLSCAQAANALRKIEVPMIVLSAGNLDDDRLEAHRALARLSVWGEHRVAARSGHWIQLDEPHLVVDAIRDILRRNRDRA